MTILLSSPKVKWMVIDSFQVKKEAAFHGILTRLKVSRVTEVLPNNVTNIGFCDRIMIVGSIRCISIGYKCQSISLIFSSNVLNIPLDCSPSCKLTNYSHSKYHIKYFSNCHRRRYVINFRLWLMKIWK